MTPRLHSFNHVSCMYKVYEVMSLEHASMDKSHGRGPQSTVPRKEVPRRESLQTVDITRKGDMRTGSRGSSKGSKIVAHQCLRSITCALAGDERVGGRQRVVEMMTFSHSTKLLRGNVDQGERVVASFPGHIE